MAKINSETSKNELVELALAGLEVQIRELNDKKEELKKLLVSSPAAKRTAKAVKVARAGKGTKAGKKGVEAKAAKVAKTPKSSKSVKSTPVEDSEDGSGKKKRVFSAATRKKLREAAKARWAREKEPKAAE
jgi:hypothetical protein